LALNTEQATEIENLGTQFEQQTSEIEEWKSAQLETIACWESSNTALRLELETQAASFDQSQTNLEAKLLQLT
jgi:hypothetical protein